MQIQRMLSKEDLGTQQLHQSRPAAQSAPRWAFYASQVELWELQQALDERGERERALRRAIQAHFDLQEPEMTYLRTGSEYIGRRVLRNFSNRVTLLFLFLYILNHPP